MASITEQEAPKNPDDLFRACLHGYGQRDSLHAGDAEAQRVPVRAKVARKRNAQHNALMVNASPIQSRDREALRLQRCHAAALGPQSATSGDEALLFQLAAELIAPRLASAAGNLVRAAEGFEKPPSVASEALRRGLIVSLPRFRERLLQQFGIRA